MSTTWPLLDCRYCVHSVRSKERFSQTWLLQKEETTWQLIICVPPEQLGSNRSSASHGIDKSMISILSLFHGILYQLLNTQGTETNGVFTKGNRNRCFRYFLKGTYTLSCWHFVALAALKSVTPTAVSSRQINRSWPRHAIVIFSILSLLARIHYRMHTSSNKHSGKNLLFFETTVTGWSCLRRHSGTMV